MNRIRGGTLAALLIIATACDGRARQPGSSDVDATEPHVAELDLTSGVAEAAQTSLFGSSGERTLTHLLLDLEELREDEAVRGVFVRLGLTRMGQAPAEALGRALAAMPDDAPVLCHAHGYGNGTMLLAATGCDEIWVSPAGSVETVGLAGQLLFGKTLLERLHVDVDFLQVGKYKGAEEPFTRDAPSPEARASLQRALGALRDAWRSSIADGRGRPAEELGLEDGPHTPEAALKLGLVDSVGYARSARTRAEEMAGVADSLPHAGDAADDASGLLRLLGDGEGLDVPHVAVLPATGSITMSGGGGLLGGGGGIAASSLSKTLHELATDESVVAVVLRIDSPGGSALASDQLWTELSALREKKPLVVSIGAMAASGGYYLACAGTRVVTERTSIIGSIGVVGGKLSFARSLEEIGVHVEVVPAVEGGSNRAVYASPFVPWSEETRQKVARSMKHTYDLFLQRIATGRGMDITAVEPHAEGRLMGGQAAVEAGLADEVGGVLRSIELARELAEAPDTTAVEVIGGGGGLLDLLAGNDASAQATVELRRRMRTEAWSSWLGPWAPHGIEIGRFLGSAAPLLQGERAVVALPFVLAVR